ncbi:protein lin-37 homolog isoform X1 [Ictalurus punctatus]|uniref:Protein lin-37 homolog isoform X1 n=2 Tax=Ictalurus punctatus TaxID=7998 RepID=A0A2D0SSD1_ICTPU|nr:protein lin-37 homolog isoform X1 [Ictalurus punctatus]XP_017345602.1 protein lin-37 homolog isoform X1 [Ictalurus punctatus]XP_017345603.1 protein lin-37 homolog isoform X1 [Ictalurus punctatus]XP_017345604.1 protein lin-37 homolog isoform X1 [Ictalurus punctatus]
MLHMKVKMEKPDTEGAVARSRLDAVLQGLVEKSDSERDQNEDDSGKMVADSMSKDLSPSSLGKRPSSRFAQHRRKKRKEMEDGLTETNQHKQNSYIIKLFDRSVDLAQFSSNTPLYPICRSWMRNNPTVRERAMSSPPHPMAEEEVSDMLNGKVQNIYHLPPPGSCPVNESGDPVNLRIPPTEKPTISQSTDTASGASSLMFNHMKRWKKIRQKWKEASNKNQLRYSESIKVLKEMYER